jgi:hypothetical protein
MSLTLKRRVTFFVVILFFSLFVLNLTNAAAFDRDEPPTYYGDPPPELLNFQPDLTNMPTTATAAQKFGIAAHPWWLDMFLDQFIAYYKDLKITTVRLPVEWKTLEPQPGVYSWELNDRLLNRLQAEGFEVVAEFVTMPAWASLNPEECAKNDLACKPDEQALPRLTGMSAALVKRYPFIRSWEFWNEPDEWPYFGKNLIEVYGLYLKTFYDAVKKVDPFLMVAATSLTGPDYMDWLYNHVDTVYGYRPFDAIAFHPYQASVPDPTPDAPFSGIRKNRVDQLRQLMVDRGDANKPIWLTEVGWQSTPEKQSLYLKDTFDWLARRPYVTMVHLHMLHDWDAELYGLVKTKEDIYWVRPLNKYDTFEPKQPYYDTFKFYDKRPLPAQPAPGPNLLVFPQTGHTVRDIFKKAWEQGGLALFGYPVTGQFYEKNPTDGHYYLVQYFERVRMEYHPENHGTPYEVLFGLLGKQVLTSKGWFNPAGDPVASPTQPEDSPAAVESGMEFFHETGHALSGVFLAEWNKEGGLKIIGLPISRVFDETNPETGEVYQVQYFERARAELHPAANGQGAYVAFGLLGNEVLRDQKRLLENNRLNTGNYYNPALPEFKVAE